MLRSMTFFSDLSPRRAKPKPRETMAKSGANVGLPKSMADRSVGQALGDYVIQTLGVAAAEVQKLYHDPLELLTRAVQPVLWLMLFGEVMARSWRGTTFPTWTFSPPRCSWRSFTASPQSGSMILGSCSAIW